MEIIAGFVLIGFPQNNTRSWVIISFVFRSQGRVAKIK